jgi:hypothetical protein
VLWENASEAERGWIIFGALVGSIGMIPDALAETLYIGLFPVIARDYMQNANASPAFEDVSWISAWMQAAQVLTGFLGNGFYCIGGLTLNIILLRASLMPRWVARGGLFIWIVGLGLSAAALTDSLTALMVLTALTMGSFVAWSAWIGWFWQEGEAA